MFAIDTNIIVYAHNTKSYCHKESKRFIEDVMNKRDENGQLFVCIPAQVLMEFVHVVTWERLESPISLKKALKIVKEYLETGIRIIHQKDTQLQTFLILPFSMATDI